MSAGDEDGERPEVRREVGDLRLGAGLEERVTHQPDEGEDEEGTGPGPERPVVDPDDEPRDHGHGRVPVPGPPQLGRLAERGLEQRVGADGDEQHEDDRVECRLRDVQPDQRSDDRPDVGDARHRQSRAQVGAHPAPVGHRRGRSPPHRAELVRGEDLRGARPRDAEQQRRQLDQATTTDDGVDPPRDEACQREQRDDLDTQVAHRGGDQASTIARMSSSSCARASGTAVTSTRWLGGMSEWGIQMARMPTCCGPCTSSKTRSPT